MKRRLWRGKQRILTSFSQRSRRKRPTPLRPGTPGSGRDKPVPDQPANCPEPMKSKNPKTQHHRAMTIKFILRLSSPVLAMAAVLTSSTGCSRSVAQQQPPAPSVTVAPVEQKDIVEWDEFTGRIEAVASVEVRPRVSG